ncbi:MAG: hypothetical protein EVA58_02740 [Kiritimatiellaceae bacterium]|nr:MAG: hypothetical protein EVA58_02740 [Kiritimatiellaceae bacterium]|tara:strand:- start:870 stop:1340 length:471 start_codon:yes stop_codon:yes gene_type:complete
MTLYLKFALLMIATTLLTSCETLNDPAFWDSLSASMNPPSYASSSQPTHYASHSLFEGAKIIASDGQFLGIATSNKFDAKSILNEYGKYGGQYSATSIFNEYGKYGGSYSAKSPFNNFASSPPKIITKNGKWAYLTTNRSKSPSVSPEKVIADITK